MPLRILSIDGGGTRGIIPATILNCIETDFGVSPLELFDVFAGTSTGGIISIGLAAGVPTDKLLDLYLKNAGEIFYESFFHEVSGLEGNVQATYKNDHLKTILNTLFGNKKLSDVQTSSNFGNKNKDLMVCSFDLSPQRIPGQNNNYRPVIFHSSFKSDQDILLTDLALRTSAGPTYFPVYQQEYIDGGVALNNPAMAAIAFAINDQKDGDGTYILPDGKNKGLGKGLNDLKLFSLSTGTGNKNRIEKADIRTGNWGNLQWIKYLPDLITESNMQSTNYYVTQVLPDPEKQYLRIDLYFDDPSAPEVLQIKPIGLDAKDPQILQGMHDFALHTYQKNKQKIVSFLGL